MYPIDLIIVYQINRFPQKRQLNVWCLFYTCSWWTPLIIQFLVRCISLWYPIKNRTKTTMCASEIPMNPTKPQWNPMKSHVFVSTPCFHGTHPMFHHRRFSWWLDLLAPCWVVSCSKSWATCRGECSNELDEGRCVTSAIFLDRLFHVCLCLIIWMYNIHMAKHDMHDLYLYNMDIMCVS